MTIYNWVSPTRQTNGLPGVNPNDFAIVSQITSNATLPAGANTQLQFNNGANAFAASGNLTFDPATNLLTVTGNISATNIVVTGNLSAVTQANSDSTTAVATTAFVQNVLTAAGGYGDAQVEALLSSGNVANNIITTSNVIGAVVGNTATYLYGDGSNITGLPAGYTDANVVTFLGSGNSLTINTTGNVTTTANIQGGYILGNGAFLTGLPAGYSDANVTTLLASGNITGNITTTGNVNGGFFYGNGAGLTGIVSSYGDSNVAAYLPTYSGNIANLLVTGNLSATTQANSDSTTAVATTAFVQNVVTAAGGYGDAQVATFLASGNLVTDILTTANIVGNNIGNSATYLYGDGSNITGLPASYGNADVELLLETGISNNIITTGNIVGANIGNTATYLWGDGSNITGVVSSYGNANVELLLETGIANNIITTGNVSANNVSVSTLGTGQVAISSSGTLVGGPDLTWDFANATLDTTSVNVSANLTVAGVSSLGPIANVLITGGNVGDTIITDGTGNLSFIPVANTQVAVIPAVTFTAVANGNSQSFSNVVLAGYQSTADLTVFRNGVLLEQSTYSLAGDVLTVDVNLTVGDNIDITRQFAGNINNVTSGYGDSNVSNYLASGADTAGIATTGNVSGLYIIGDGSQLTGLPAGYTDANVQTLLASGNLTGNIITLGNVQAGAFIGDGSFLSGMYGDPNVEVLLANVPASVVPATANIYTVGNATNPFGAVYTTSLQLGATSLNLTGNAITTTGDTIYVDPLNDGSLRGNVVILGNLQVSGNLTYADATSATTANLLWIAANDANSAALASGAGLGIGANAEYATFTFNAVSNTWDASLPITSANFIGDGSLLTNITGANVTGVVALATQADTANTAATVTDNAQPNITSVGTLSSLNVSGNVLAGNIQTTALNATTVGGTLTTASQPNVTTVGTLTTLSVAGGGTIAGNLSAGNITTSTLTAGGIVTSGGSGNISGVNYYLGNAVSVTGDVAGATLTATGNIAINGNGELTVATNNGHGGTNYAGIMTMTNTGGGATNPNKFLRLNNTGALEIVNSAYSATIFALTDSGNISAVNNLSAVNITTSGDNAFVAGSGAISGVALNMPHESAIRNYDNGTNTMYFDVSAGGTATGVFNFRSSNAYTSLATIDSTGITVPSMQTDTGNVAQAVYFNSTTKRLTVSAPVAGFTGYTGFQAPFSGALTSANLGQFIQANGDVTMPAAGTVPAGTVFTIFSLGDSSQVPLTMRVNNNATDFFYCPPMLPANTRTFLLYEGQWAQFLSRGTGEWDVIASNLQTPFTKSCAPGTAWGTPLSLDNLNIRIDSGNRYLYASAVSGSFTAQGSALTLSFSDPPINDSFNNKTLSAGTWTQVTAQKSMDDNGDTFIFNMIDITNNRSYRVTATRTTNGTAGITIERIYSSN